MVTDAREPSRGYHVPSTDNTISEDMARLILALTAVGVDVAGLLEAVASKAAAIHDHQIADIIGLVAALANKASADHVHALGGLSDVDTAGASVYQVLAKSIDGKWRPWTIDLANAIGGAAYARLDGATFTGPTKVPTPSTEANSLNAVNVTSLRAFVTSAVAALTLLMEGYVSHSQEQTLSAEQKARAQTNLGLEGLQNALTPFGFTATAGQTAFALGMSPLPSACIFSLNGSWLTGAGVDYTVTGSTLTLSTPAEAGDRIAGVAIAPFTVANAMLSAANLADLANMAVARANLGLGSAAVLNAGTGANELLKLDGAGKIPAVDGSQITGIPFSKEWSSGELSIDVGTIVSLPHTLGVFPKLIDAVLVCKTAEHGFSVNDEYRINGVIVASGNPPLMSFSTTATNLTIIIQSSASYSIMHKTTRAWSTPTFANWKLKIRAFA